MRAQSILLRQLETELAEIHKARLKLFFTAVLAVLTSGKLSLTGLGRAIAAGTTHKHGIKRIDRLLGNRHLQKAKLQFYRVVARRILGASLRPVILVDWTDVTPNLWALTAAVTCDGRALILYAETHPISRYMKPRVHAKFLQTLQRILPSNCKPIIVADAGFRRPFMKLVTAVQWDYVIRLRKNASIRPVGGQRWTSLTTLFGRAREIAEDLGPYSLSIRGRHICRIITFRRNAPRSEKRYRARGKHEVAKHRRAYKEPWILATSLHESPAQIVSIYTKRMQIEETFRDTKNPRFGFSLGHANPRSDRRADILLLLAAFAHLLAVLIGMVAEAAGWHRNYQANTERHRRVLSLATLGRFIVADALSQVLVDASSTFAWSVLRATCSSTSTA